MAAIIDHLRHHHQQQHKKTTACEIMLWPFFCSSPNYRFVDVDKLESPGNSGSRFIIRRLRKYTKYEIVVQAVNTFGEGPLSIPSIGQTQEDGKCSFLFSTLKH